MRTILPFPAMIVPYAKCRVGITLDPVKKEATYRDDWPRAGRFMLLHPKPLAKSEALGIIFRYARLCRCEYDYLPDESSLFGEWYVYHFMQGGRGIRALR